MGQGQPSSINYMGQPQINLSSIMVGYRGNSLSDRAHNNNAVASLNYQRKLSEQPEEMKLNDNTMQLSDIMGSHK
jgi:hypothetical protein